MSHKQAWQIDIEAAIKAHDYASAQRKIDTILDSDPHNKEAHILQEEILVRRTQEDDKNRTIIQGGLAQFATFAFGTMFTLGNLGMIWSVLYNVLILHNSGSITTQGRGGYGPFHTYSASAIIIGSLIASCIGLWIVKTAFDAWKNS